jgi:hypothetical protein
MMNTRYIKVPNKVCHWQPHAGNPIYKCDAPATHFFESGLGYCAVHAGMVKLNRDWLEAKLLESGKLNGQVKW